MIDHPGFDRLDDELTGKLKDAERAGDDELIAEQLGLGEPESDESSLDVPGDELDSGDAGAADEMLGRKSAEAVSAGEVLAADAEQAPDVLTSFLEVERRIKHLVEEKRRLIKERDGLREELEETMLKMTRSEERMSELLSIKEEYKTSIDQQEMVRTKVEGLLALLEDEEG